MFSPLNRPFGQHCIETCSGVAVDLYHPDAASIRIHDIAWALSRLSRFAGHSISDEIWSVGQHSLLTVSLIEASLVQESTHESLREFMGNLDVSFAELDIDKARIHALLHDASEAYLVDVPSPLKRVESIRAGYLEIEARMQATIYEALGLPQMTEVESSIVKWADLLALRVEAANLLPTRGIMWGFERPCMEYSEMRLMPKVKPWKEVMRDFKKMYEELKPS